MTKMIAVKHDFGKVFIRFEYEASILSHTADESGLSLPANCFRMADPKGLRQSLLQVHGCYEFIFVRMWPMIHLTLLPIASCPRVISPSPSPRDTH